MNDVYNLFYCYQVEEDEDIKRNPGVYKMTLMMV